MPGSEQEVRIRVRDGVELAATLYLPDASTGTGTGQPQPCLLEALPYRKDDLTSSSAENYRRLRDEFGYAVCRLDLRGTGSSAGDATDEYPPTEEADLVEVIAWLADQPWCDGNVGMWGTSYSGFNSLQAACARPPALKAICAIFASDDRWTDDVHWRGGALKLVDLVDYNHYMTPMTMLPPVPAVWGDGWREEWRRRIQTQEPWVLTWLREDRDGDYWRHGSVRDADGTGYERIDCAVMLVAGWADGYRNNSFRTVEALRAAGVPHRLLAGPWAHADPTTAMPGPRIDLDVEMVAWFDRWLRGTGEQDDRVDVFVRTSTRPEADLDLHEGYWVSDTWPSASTRVHKRRLDGPRSLEVRPDVGTAAWIDCAGHLPWGQSGDQRTDDDRSLTWDWAVSNTNKADSTNDTDATAETVVIGQPVVRLRVCASAPAASLSVKLCDVLADGTSALVTRGSLDLRFRDDVHGPAKTLEPGQEYDVTLTLDACAYAFSPGQTMRLSVAGADWPNTVAPPAPLTLTVLGGELELPLWGGSDRPTPTFVPGAERSSEDPAGVSWTITDDVLRRTTTCSVRHGTDYPTPYDGHAWESYAGDVVVDRRSFAQQAEADCSYRLTWPGIDLRVESTMRVTLGTDALEVSIEATAYDGEEQVAQRTWEEKLRR